MVKKPTKFTSFCLLLLAIFTLFYSTRAHAITSKPTDIDQQTAIDDTDLYEKSPLQPTVITIPFSLNGVSPTISTHSPKTREVVAEAIGLGSPNAALILGYGTLIVGSSSKNFSGMITFDDQLEPGTYRISVKVPKYAKQIIASTLIIAPNGTATMASIKQPVRLFAGDTDEDGSFTIFDYNFLVGCMKTTGNTTLPICDSELSQQTDLNEDGDTDQVDYNLFLRSLRESALNPNSN